MTNRLAKESSPYLRQHQDNPVDWWPWGEPAFQDARRRDVPILLSIGYSACHWCHVMAHESFEDPEVAEVMNRHFVNVKVDREERPDVDAVYMEATQAMTGGGGWPMTVFLTPDGRPFFAGTYFPKETVQGRPGFVPLMEAVAEAWARSRGQVLEQADQLAAAVRARTDIGPGGGTELSAEMVTGGYEALRQAFDREWGGFGRAPKFPQVSYLELVSRVHRRRPGAESLEMITTTLDAMASGGIYDHVGGGFSRYSVDAFWMVPHFEKMLYDQAQLLRSYLHGWQLTGEQRYRQVAEEIVGYVLGDLRSPEGGIWSAEDADSEGEEGRFYVWRPEEINEAVGPELAPAAMEWWGVTRAGNFEGSNILHRPVRGDLIRPPEVERARQLLLAAREKRVRPGLDDKVLTEWNAMFVSALAEAAAALGRPDWLAAATGTAEFLLDELRLPGGRWMRSWQGGRARHLAYAADHAWLVDAFTRLAEATGQARWVVGAGEAADSMLELFWDDENGGLFTAGDDAERLIVRSKDYQDGATPSANSVAALALLRLGALTGDSRHTSRGREILEWLGEPMARFPHAFTYALGAVDLVLSGVTEVAVVGDRPDLVRTVQEQYLPESVLAWGEPFDSPLWQGREPGRAYVCRDYACRAPVTEPAELLAQLGVDPGIHPLP